MWELELILLMDVNGYKFALILTWRMVGDTRRTLWPGGNLDPVPGESVYSVVISLRGARLRTFLSELNGITTWTRDARNANLGVHTKEPVRIAAVIEFGELEVRAPIIAKALHALKSSGLLFHEWLASCLREIGSSRAEE